MTLNFSNNCLLPEVVHDDGCLATIVLNFGTDASQCIAIDGCNANDQYVMPRIFIFFAGSWKLIHHLEIGEGAQITPQTNF